MKDEKGDKELFSVYVPTNHIYVGDIFLLEKCDIIRPNLSVREGLGKPSPPSHSKKPFSMLASWAAQFYLKIFNLKTLLIKS